MSAQVTVFNLECVQFSSFPLQSTGVVYFNSYKFNYRYCVCLTHVFFDLLAFMQKPTTITSLYTQCCLKALIFQKLLIFF